MKIAILITAYGASNPGARESLGRFEAVCKNRFPDYPLRWAYTSLLIRERIARNMQKADSVRKALMRLYYEKYSAVVVQPLQTIAGKEYEDVWRACLNVQKETGLTCSIGAPLLSSPADVSPLAAALFAHLPEQRSPEDCVIFMGHGAKHPAGAFYASLGNALNRLDGNIFLGTMNEANNLETILPKIRSRNVWLLPLLSIVGKHAINDMAGPAESSWKTRIEAHGLNCVPVLKGTSEYSGIINIWLDNLEKAIGHLGKFQ